jgi:hypothetical protein
MARRGLVILAVIVLSSGASKAQAPAAQEAVIAPAENLLVDGVPKIPASLVDTAGRYG